MSTLASPASTTAPDPLRGPVVQPWPRTRAHRTAGGRFDANERAFLLRQRGIAEVVLAGLEEMGIASLQALAHAGADDLCMRMRAAHGRDVWGNRRRALQGAIDAAIAAGLASAALHCARPASGRVLANC